MAGSGQTLEGRDLILRADASTVMGTGHLMRLLGLGQAWRDRRGSARLLVADAPTSLLGRFDVEGIAIERVPTSHPDPGDAAQLRTALTRGANAWAAVDGPAFDPRYADDLAGETDRLLLVDDLASWPRYRARFVLNQNAHADRANYPESPGTRFLLGPAYALLRREFRDPVPPRTVPSLARRLLVTFGGADPAGMTERTVAAVMRLPADLLQDLEVRVIIGAANPAVAAIEAVAAGSATTFILKQAVSDMRAVLDWADLAVTSGGTTVWELARMGCPAIVVETALSEPFLVAGLARLGLFDRLGSSETLSDDRLTEAIADRMRDAAWRRQMIELGSALVDGRGADRVVDALIDADRDTSVGSR